MAERGSSPAKRVSVWKLQPGWSPAARDTTPLLPEPGSPAVIPLGGNVYVGLVEPALGAFGIVGCLVELVGTGSDRHKPDIEERKPCVSADTARPASKRSRPFPCLQHAK